MDPQDTKKLRALTDFAALVAYLRDELDWPIEVEDADDITFEYDPEELGIDPQHAVKIEMIKQVRPLVDGQPWGIFYIEFEAKRLPVVVLRRILRTLVPTGRQRAPNRPAWRMSDLLFISAQGEVGYRSISFAHFRQRQGRVDELRTFSWDSRETHFYYLKNLNLEALRWPDDEADAAAWREQWGRAFTVEHRYVITTSQTLAREMAHQARTVRELVSEVYGLEAGDGPLHRLYDSFKEVLLHDLMPGAFADMVAQTVAYGLFSAAAQTDDLSYEHMIDLIPNTNPFLRDLLAELTAGGAIDIEELGVSRLVDLLRATDTDAILHDFGRQTGASREDPVIHFYEDFLREYDQEQRVRRGVFYTPDPVVSYIVRSVDYLLKTEFGLEDGLANISVDPETGTPLVQILDPAAGTGTFLAHVVDQIERTIKAKPGADWNAYVAEHLLPRLNGFELMMAPYAVAHMKLGLKLRQTGYDFRSGERLRIYLTNTLEEPVEMHEHLALAGFLSKESNEAARVKRGTPITVVIGNPPYSKFSVNNSVWISELMETYKSTVRSEEVQIQALSDDYAKFIRFAHYEVAKTNWGIVGLITNSGYLDGPLFRDLRTALLRDFDKIWIVNLEGDSRKRATGGDDVQDENVFEIQQGVAIAILVRKSQSARPARVFYQSIVETRAMKYDFLCNNDISTCNWIAIKPKAPNNIFVPRSSQGAAEWDSAWKLPEVFKGGVRTGRALPFFGAGFATRHDLFAVAFSEDELLHNVHEFLDPSSTEAELRKRFHLCTTTHWSFHKARRYLTVELAREKLTRFLYRPFDWRYMCYTDLMIGEMRPDIMMNLIHHNVALVTTRRSTGRQFDNFFVSNTLVEYKAGTHDRNTQVFPLYLYIDEENAQYSFLDVCTRTDRVSRRPNLGLEFIGSTEDHLGMRFVTDGRGDLHQTFGPEDVFYYAYAVFHSPIYRTRYAEFLKIDFPRLPLTSDRALFAHLVALGADLVALHLLEDDYPAASWNQGQPQGSPLQQPITTFVERATGTTVGAFSRSTCYQDGRVYLDTSQRSRSSYFDGVPEEVWNFHIGGYQVLHKWLYDRRGVRGEPGRTLTEEDIAHYQRIVVALQETMRLMGEIDAVIEAHGGWPIE